MPQCTKHRLPAAPVHGRGRRHVGRPLPRAARVSLWLLAAALPAALASAAPADSATAPLSDSVAASVKTRPDWAYVKSYPLDAAAIVTSPARWRAADWIAVPVVAGATLLLYAGDEPIRDAILRHRTTASGHASTFFRLFGTDWPAVSALAGAGVCGLALNSERLRAIGLRGLQSLVYTTAITQALKLTFHRHRPSTGGPNNRWDGPSLSQHNLSFPSGHATCAFTVATVIAEECKDIRIVPPVAYSIAALTGLSRMHDNRHWASDVFVGAAIGYFTARAVVRRHKPRRVAIVPSTDGQSASLSVTVRCDPDRWMRQGPVAKPPTVARLAR